MDMAAWFRAAERALWSLLDRAAAPLAQFIHPTTLADESRRQELHRLFVGHARAFVFLAIPFIVFVVITTIGG